MQQLPTLTSRKISREKITKNSHLVVYHGKILAAIPFESTSISALGRNNRALELERVKRYYLTMPLKN